MFCREKPTRLHLVRHGEVDEAYHEVFGGQIDMELSPNGHEQAKRLAKFLGDRHFDHIYRSPMVRVRQTAKPLLDALDREAEVIDDLREVDFGVWTGYKWHEIQEKFGVDAEDWLVLLPPEELTPCDVHVPRDISAAAFFIVAAVLTPTGDPATLTLMAAPMIALYGLSIIIAWLVSPKRNPTEEQM